MRDHSYTMYMYLKRDLNLEPPAWLHPKLHDTRVEEAQKDLHCSSGEVFDDHLRLITVF